MDCRVVGTTDGTTAALLNHEVDAALATPDAALADPGRVSILAGLADRPPLSMISQPELASFEDVRGRSIGTSSFTEGTVQLIKAMMTAHGLEYGTKTWPRGGTSAAVGGAPGGQPRRGAAANTLR
jgi:NMT1/THI5 like